MLAFDEIATHYFGPHMLEVCKSVSDIWQGCLLEFVNKSVFSDHHWISKPSEKVELYAAYVLFYSTMIFKMIPTLPCFSKDKT